MVAVVGLSLQLLSASVAVCVCCLSHHLSYLFNGFITESTTIVFYLYRKQLLNNKRQRMLWHKIYFSLLART